MARQHVLVVDDKRDLAHGVALVLSELSKDITVTYSAEEALEILRQRPADLLVTDIRLPGKDGLDLLREVRALLPRCRVILFTGFGTIDAAVRAMKEGAFHYLTKPFDNDELVVLARRALKEVADEDELERLRAELNQRHSFCGLVGRDRKMQALFETIPRVAASAAAVLIRGESGTGKELVARAIHDSSPRKNGRFVAFNAAAVPEGLAEAELFGAKKGAYTGAQADRKGLFAMADGGTLFIDEVAAMPLPLQGKLLRALQEHEIQPLGSDRPVPVDVRVVSAMNEDPQRLIKEGRLRRDIYYRLAVVTICIPPLRDRPEDIALLAQTFLAAPANLCGDRPRTLGPGALRALVAHDWPGNVRELANVIERACLLASGDEIAARDIVLDGEEVEVGAPVGEHGYEASKRQALEQFQRRYVEQLLGEHHGNISAAAATAGMTRAALHRIIKRLGQTV